MKMEKQLVTGWAGVVVLLTSLRLVGTNPTTYGWFGGLAVLTVVLVAWQITRVLASWRGDNLTVKATWWLVWRHWWRILRPVHCGIVGWCCLVEWFSITGVIRSANDSGLGIFDLDRFINSWRLVIHWRITPSRWATSRFWVTMAAA
ncbi:hypothetical protein LL936_01825 [Levilactobacillus brevis]|uniref:hypothetical protein n=1 Tax=Levilactobacillus brevis TaxID=1580 RepID=UPI001F161760|nr:hypothetical protein [Levilactobacillus brevis]MCE6009506.1 hypothetical protein [Levilactobacillus brevis]MCE6012415.1 hypothetical protein [Levilactobacillus brevis]MCE6014846.1 hypothetical protein [Levilactobacillus brevis]MCE6017186.1 hypothetical protein [Levilactobacillus brevis]MCE6019454.1 hypothetical protein [Levilactobacillus brevis]